MPIRKRLVRFAACAVLTPAALAIALGHPGSSIAASSSVPGASIAFDQIDRILIGGATPPPVGAFRADAATIASLPPLDAGVRNIEDAQKAASATASGSMLVSGVLGMIPFVGGFLGGAAAHAANSAAQANLQREIINNNAAVMHFITAGKLSRFAFYHGGARAEHVGRDVTIVSPDGRFTTVLDVAKKTAHTSDASVEETYVVSSEGDEAAPALDGPASIQSLPDANIEGMRARGYRTTATLVLPHAAAWCAAGRHPITQIEYVVDRPDPQPAARISPLQQLSDGCTPNSTASYREPGRLVVYRATSVDPGTPLAVSIMFERANIRTLDATNLSLFTIPPGYMKEP
ncbi:MAG: hypothetical protein JO043_06045 [Candidatus Eremiobacteraeota bacterium]|nr:hypothetical protein [Candidatus Eremiobacteraeota bacterium]